MGVFITMVVINLWSPTVPRDPDTCTSPIGDIIGNDMACGKLIRSRRICI